MNKDKNEEKEGFVPPGRGMGYGRSRGCRFFGHHCFRFPWLPRWWWADEGSGSTMPAPTDEKEMLKEQLAALEEDMKMIRDRLRKIKG